VVQDLLSLVIYFAIASAFLGWGKPAVGPARRAKHRLLAKPHLVAAATNRCRDPVGAAVYSEFD
jgi:hypothetical protein